jgi:hypothetical protein
MQKLFILITVLSLSLSVIYAQSTALKLPTADNTSSFNITNNSDGLMLKLGADGEFFISGNVQTGTIPVQGAGTRMLWHPYKAAFRAGTVNSFGATYWDDINIGCYSAAFGNNSRASGDNSFAAGLATTASGSESVAFGNSSTASGDRTFTFNGTASGVGAIAMGSGAQATMDDALALGPSSIAGGLASVAIGPSIANGSFAIAIGLQNRAEANFSVAIGKNCKATHQGAMVLGDASASFSSDSITSTGNNSMTMRFVGGYRLYTTVNKSTGVALTAGGASWSSVSDSTKKTNFLKADGEYFLSSLSKLKLGSWNYKSQTPGSFRHYGPMAQEIFRYFGKDKLGVIGNDTTLATADMDGIMMICLQALEKRTEELQSAVVKIDELAAANHQMALENATQRKLINELLSRFEKVEAKLKEFDDNAPKVKLVNALSENQGVNK